MEGFRDLRGIRGLRIADMIRDTAEELEYGIPQRMAGVEEISQDTEESTGTRNYDNQAAIVINSEGKDIFSLITSVLEDSIKAKIEGRKYDEQNCAYFGTPLKRPYLALGFIGKDTNNDEWYYWVYKGKLTGGKEKYQTENEGTDTTNLEWEYNSIYTSHKFRSADNNPLKFYRMKAGGSVTEEEFFKEVFNPDTLTVNE